MGYFDNPWYEEAAFADGGVIRNGREILFQGFNWESHKSDWWVNLEKKVTDLAESGFTSVWLPPATHSVSSEGYLPQNLYSLDSSYGSELQLKVLLQKLSQHKIRAMADIVINHRVGTTQGHGGAYNRFDGIPMSWDEHAITSCSGGLSSVSPNPELCTIEIVGSSRFKTLFWAFGPSISRWEECRPVLSLDGTFLLGKYCGTLLAAVGIDGNGRLFPLAFAVVESYSNHSWVWFLQNLHDLVGVVKERTNLCIISDKHPGLVRGCREIFPNAAHRHCLRHLRENFKKFTRRNAIADSEGLCNNMYLAGITEDMSYFNRMMNHIRTAKQEAYDWLIQRDVSKWSLLFDNGCRYSIMTTNASECFNGVLKRARGLPIQGLVMTIYYNLVSLFMRRSTDVEK
ncbi:hypothetical protein M5K25_016755 [Dendrobium thyrsiflorum]|uniref:Glycosyl hydrolase family 13 catalytic domain-containing protein n=1 Tax=Dendrobium thyrsiflorum TaxID=117978 RepID=A0ABD0UKL3_DENTH